LYTKIDINSSINLLNERLNRIEIEIHGLLNQADFLETRIKQHSSYLGIPTKKGKSSQNISNMNKLIRFSELSLEKDFYTNPSQKSYSQFFLVKAFEEVAIIKSYVETVAHTTAIEVKNIRPREVQSLMDEVEARINEGSLF
jgi:hypothetical protein